MASPGLSFTAGGQIFEGGDPHIAGELLCNVRQPRHHPSHTCGKAIQHRPRRHLGTGPNACAKSLWGSWILDVDDAAQ